MKLTLGTTLWARPRIEILTLRYYERLAQEANVDVELVCAVSEDWAESAAQACGWRTVRTPNAPLGRKHNVMLAEVRETKPDAFILIGSDDWLVSREPPHGRTAGTIGTLEMNASGFTNVFDRYAAHGERSLVGITDLWVVDLPTQRAAWWSNPPIPIGAGRMVRADVLDAADWTLWPDDAEKGLDAPMGQRLRGGHWRSLQWATDGVACIDFKTGVNLWSFEAFEKRATPCALTVPLGALPDWARADLGREWPSEADVSPPEAVR